MRAISNMSKADRMAARYRPAYCTVAVERPELQAVIYHSPDRLHGIAYRGTGYHPAWHYTFRRAEDFDARVVDFFAGIERSRQAKAEWKERRLADAAEQRAKVAAAKVWLKQEHAEPQKAVHIRMWTGTGSARITDMADAGKRGRTCRVLQFSGYSLGCYTALHGAQQAASDATDRIFLYLRNGAVNDSFEVVCARMLAEVEAGYATGATKDYLRTEDAQIRGIDAPKPVLTAGVSEVWSGHADEDGVSLSDHSDHCNEPRECTFRQTPSEAYRIAAIVWPRVKLARTMNEASTILSEAGCRLHYWCSMD